MRGENTRGMGRARKIKENFLSVGCTMKRPCGEVVVKGRTVRAKRGDVSKAGKRMVFIF